VASQPAGLAAIDLILRQACVQGDESCSDCRIGNAAHATLHSHNNLKAAQVSPLRAG
jgi:hypothetical protein